MWTTTTPSLLLLQLLLCMAIMGHPPLTFTTAQKTMSSPYASDTTAPKKKSSSSSSTSKVKRINQLDYFDIDTMLYYLQAPALEYDVAVLFYAQWCKNCHAFAPLWDQISRYMHAGTKQSQLIMGLFDCEANYQHAELCTERVGITHYPTIVYMSMAGNTLQKKKKRKGRSKDKRNIMISIPTHITTFPGNWQYGDAVMDWLNALSKLSNWHRHDYGSRIRQWILFGGRSHKNHPNALSKQALPIGIPSDARNQQEILQLQTLQTETNNLAVRSSIFVDCLLLPKSATEYLLQSSTSTKTLTTKELVTMADSHGKNYTDVYALLQHRNAWKAASSSSSTSTTTTTTDLVLRTCASEVSLDYCTRLSEQYADTWLKERLGSSSSSSSLDITEAEYLQFSDHLHKYLNETEPFCAVMDECVMVNFENAEKCQPSKCPFRDPVACRYLTACLTEPIQIEYAEAMQLVIDTNPSKKGGAGSSISTTTTTNKSDSNTSRKSKEEPPGAGGEGGEGGKRKSWGL